MNTVKLQATFNFGGFYNSNHDWVIDNFIDTYISDRETEELPDNAGEIYDSIDYKGLRNFYCSELIKFINKKLDINLEYIELNSPAYYNFTTDKIVVKFDERDFSSLKEYVSYYILGDIDENIAELLKEWTTRRDGFIPYYSYSEIKDDLKWQMEVVFTLLAQNCLGMDDDFWYEWYDNIDDLLWQVGESFGVGLIEPIYINEEE